MPAEYIAGGCVRRLMKLALDQRRDGVSPEVLAEKAGLSARTIWRKLEVPDDPAEDFFELFEADELLTAAGYTIYDCDIFER